MACIKLCSLIAYPTVKFPIIFISSVFLAKKIRRAPSKAKDARQITQPPHDRPQVLARSGRIERCFRSCRSWSIGNHGKIRQVGGFFGRSLTVNHHVVGAVVLHSRHRIAFVLNPGAIDAHQIGVTVGSVGPSPRAIVVDRNRIAVGFSSSPRAILRDQNVSLRTGSAIGATTLCAATVSAGSTAARVRSVAALGGAATLSARTVRSAT